MDKTQSQRQDKTKQFVNNLDKILVTNGKYHQL